MQIVVKKHRLLAVVLVLAVIISIIVFKSFSSPRSVTIRAFKNDREMFENIALLIIESSDDFTNMGFSGSSFGGSIRTSDQKLATSSNPSSIWDATSIWEEVERFFLEHEFRRISQVRSARAGDSEIKVRFVTHTNYRRRLETEWGIMYTGDGRGDQSSKYRVFEKLDDNWYYYEEDVSHDFKPPGGWAG